MHFFRMFIGISITLFLTSRIHIYFSMVLFLWVIIFMIVSIQITSRLDIYTMNRAGLEAFYLGVLLII